MATLNSLLTALSKSQPKTNSSWGGSHTWGGKTTASAVPTFGKKRSKSDSQQIADGIMAKSKVKASKSHESFLGSILGGAADVTGNLVGDIVDTAENVPSGLYKIATTNPVDTVKAIGQDYKARYGKLFSGDFGGFAHDLAEHPFGYILDAATLGTGGAGALARAGVLSKDLTTTGLSLDRAATAAGVSAKVPVNLSRNPFTRQIQKGSYALQSKLPEGLPVLGENATADRAVAQSYRHDIAGLPQAEKQVVRDAYKGHFGEASLASLSKYSHHASPGGVLGKSTQIWKDLVLAGRPAFQINNLVGNTGMAGSVLGKSFVKAQTMATKGELNKAADYFQGSMHSFGGTEKSTTENPGLYRRTVNKSYNLQGKHETMLRKSVMYAAAMKVPEIKTLVRQGTGQGLSEGDALASAFGEAFKGEHGAALHREIRNKIDDTLGDYSRYSAAEQRIKKVIPFYGWNRHASRYLYATARDRPGELLALNQVSKIGEQFHEDTGWAGTPDFMKGYLNIGGHTFDTAPLNPLKGGTDTLKSVKEIISGNPSTEGTDLGGNLNPFISSAIQGLTGKNLLTGAPIPRTTHGLLGSVAQQTVTGLPQWKLAMKAVPDSGLDVNNPHTFLTPTGELKAKFKNADTGKVTLDKNGNPVEQPGRHMLNSSFQSLLATFLGIPDRGTVNKKVAQEVTKTIETEKHPNAFRPRKKAKKKAKTSFKAVVDTQKASGWGASQSNWGS